MSRWILILPLMVFARLGTGQAVSNKGRFSIAFDRGCTPMTVKITAIPDFRDVTTTYSFSENQAFNTDTTFTYTESGSYTIVQLVAKDSLNGEPLLDKQDSLVIEALDSQIPDVQVTKCTGALNFTSLDTYYDAVRLYFSSIDSVTLKEGESISKTLMNASQRDVQVKGLFENASEVCSIYSLPISTVSEISAPEILGVEIKQTCRDVYTLRLSLGQIDTETQYQVILEQANMNVIFDGFIDSTFLNIEDVPFTNSRYCVSVVAFDPCVGSERDRKQICETPSLLSLSPFEHLYSTYTENGVFINIDSTAAGSFRIERKSETGSFSLRSTENAPFIDPISSSSRKYFYKIDYEDVCGETLYSALTNPPLVEPELIAANLYSINYTPATNSLEDPEILSYRLEGNQVITEELELSTTIFEIRLTPDQGVNQSMLVQSENAQGIALRSNRANLRYEFVVYVPSAFTPNGDQINDRLQFFGIPTGTATIKIFSRGGQNIYTTTDPVSGWDGRIDGDLAQQGTYLYEIVLETQSGNKLRQRGTFVLLEK
ncbi:MAG: gliding motility-associated C-terminal domain-containing protein [Bacteroidota bacterium]